MLSFPTIGPIYFLVDNPLYQEVISQFSAQQVSQGQSTTALNVRRMTSRGQFFEVFLINSNLICKASWGPGPPNHNQFVKFAQKLEKLPFGSVGFVFSPLCSVPDRPGGNPEICCSYQFERRKFIFFSGHSLWCSQARSYVPFSQKVGAVNNFALFLYSLITYPPLGYGNFLKLADNSFGNREQEGILINVHQNHFWIGCLGCKITSHKGFESNTCT